MAEQVIHEEPGKLPPGGTAPGPVDPTQRCPVCGQTIDKGYLSRSVPIVTLPIVGAVTIRVLYSSACGFLRFVLFD